MSDRFLAPLLGFSFRNFDTHSHLVALAQPIHSLFIAGFSRLAIPLDRRGQVFFRVGVILTAHLQNADQFHRITASLFGSFLKKQESFIVGFRVPAFIAVQRFIIQRHPLQFVVLHEWSSPYLSIPDNVLL